MNVNTTVGVFISEDGKVFDSSEKLIEPLTDKSGYKFLDETVLKTEKPLQTIIDDKGIPRKGFYLHRMIVFSFGDKNGRNYLNTGVRNIVDHLDMNHGNNAKSNLQLVSNGINLFRAYYKTNTDACKERLINYWNTLSELEKKIFLMEIEMDINGKY